MRILYINKTFSGPLEEVAKIVAQNKEHSSMFMAEHWPKTTSVPGIRLMRLAYAHDVKSRNENERESLLMRYFRNANMVKVACARLRRNGFVPDVIYASTAGNYVQGAMDIFPEARIVIRLEWMGASSVSQASSSAKTHADVYNAMQMALLSECAEGICPTMWHKNRFGSDFESKIRVIRNGVNTHFFKPDPAAIKEGNIVFACHGLNPDRGFYEICQCLPELLTLRPHCRVSIVSFAGRRSEAGRGQHVKELEAQLPSLKRNQRARVEILGTPNPNNYRALLQRASIYVYLTSPSMLSAGILEAMSCGALVLASDTESVSEVVLNGQNGLLRPKSESESLAFSIAQVCERSSELLPLGNIARKYIIDHHDLRKILPLHAAAVLGVQI